MGRVHWHRQNSSIKFDGRWYGCLGAFTKKDEAEREAKKRLDDRWIRVRKYKASPRSRAKDYVWVVWGSIDLKPIKFHKGSN